MDIDTVINTAIILFCAGSMLFVLKVKRERKQIERELKQIEQDERLAEHNNPM